MRAPLCIGISLQADGAHLVARRDGQDQLVRHFSGRSGRRALESYVASLQGPVRLAVSAGALGLAMALGAPPGREVVLVAAAVADQPAALARFAERSL